MITVEMVRDKGFEFVEGDWLLPQDVHGKSCSFEVNSLTAGWLNKLAHCGGTEVEKLAWRDNKGEIPCDGELWVEIEFYDSLIRQFETHKACDIDWEEDLQMKWRPSLKNWEIEMNLDKIETQEEKEAFDGMAKSSEAHNGSEWNGEGLPPVGVECEAVFIHHEHKGYGEFLICGYHKSYVWMEYVGNLSNKSKHYTAMVCDVVFRKPETPEQKAERERLEAAIYLHDIANLRYYEGCLPFGCEWDKAGYLVKEMWLSIVDETGYRKQNG